jgi:hypothetical protein
MVPTDTRPEIILAALLYLLTAYQRRPCAGLAACIARHFHSLSQHPGANRLIADVAAASTAEWEAAAREEPVTVIRRAGLMKLALH